MEATVFGIATLVSVLPGLAVLLGLAGAKFSSEAYMNGVCAKKCPLDKNEQRSCRRTRSMLVFRVLANHFSDFFLFTFYNNMPKHCVAGFLFFFEALPVTFCLGKLISLTSKNRFSFLAIVSVLK